MNKAKFNSIMALNSDTYTSLASKLGISRMTLSNKLNSEDSKGFTQVEIGKIRDIYGLNAKQIEEIFFEKECQ